MSLRRKKNYVLPLNQLILVIHRAPSPLTARSNALGQCSLISLEFNMTSKSFSLKNKTRLPHTWVQSQLRGSEQIQQFLNKLCKQQQEHQDSTKPQSQKHQGVEPQHISFKNICLAIASIFHCKIKTW